MWDTLLGITLLFAPFLLLSKFTEKKQGIKEEKDRLKGLIDGSDKNVDDWLVDLLGLRSAGDSHCAVSCFPVDR